MDIYVVVAAYGPVEASASLQGAELIRIGEAEKQADATGVARDHPHWPLIRNDAYDALRVVNCELRDAE